MENEKKVEPITVTKCAIEIRNMDCMDYPKDVQCTTIKSKDEFIKLLESNQDYIKFQFDYDTFKRIRCGELTELCNKYSYWRSKDGCTGFLIKQFDLMARAQEQINTEQDFELIARHTDFELAKDQLQELSLKYDYIFESWDNGPNTAYHIKFMRAWSHPSLVKKE